MLLHVLCFIVCSLTVLYYNNAAFIRLSVSWKTKGIIKLRYLENKFLVLKIHELLKTPFIFKKHVYNTHLHNITCQFLLFKMSENFGTSA